MSAFILIYSTVQIVDALFKFSLLPAQVANHSAGFGLSCSLMELTT